MIVPVNEDSVNSAVSRDGATFHEYIERQVLGRKRKFTSFECQCGNDAEKDAWAVLHKGGAYCGECTRANALQKRRKTLAKAPPVVNIEQPLWILSDSAPYQLGLNDDIQLRLAPSSLNPILTKALKKVRSLKFTRQVDWWDIEGNSCRQRSKIFDYPGQDEQAVALYSSKQSQYRGKEVIVTLKLKDVMVRQAWYQKHFRLHLVPEVYPEVPLPLEAYFMGAWLGDGSSGAPAITNIDEEIVEYCRDYATRLGLNFKQLQQHEEHAPTYAYSGTATSRNLIIDGLRQTDVWKNKHLPRAYLENSRENRLQLLAGLLDTDGYCCNGTGYDFVQKSEAVFDGVVELCTGLGFRMTKKEKVASCVYKGEKVYCDVFRGRMTGTHLCDVPVKLPRKKITRQAQAIFLPRFTVSNDRWTSP